VQTVTSAIGAECRNGYLTAAWEGWRGIIGRAEKKRGAVMQWCTDALRRHFHIPRFRPIFPPKLFSSCQAAWMLSVVIVRPQKRPWLAGLFHAERAAESAPSDVFGSKNLYGIPGEHTLVEVQRQQAKSILHPDDRIPRPGEGRFRRGQTSDIAIRNMGPRDVVLCSFLSFLDYGSICERLFPF